MSMTYEGFTYGRIYNNNIARSDTPIWNVILWLSPAFDVTGRDGHLIVFNYHDPGMRPGVYWNSDYAEASMYITLTDDSSFSDGFMGNRLEDVEHSKTLPTNVKTLVVATTFDLDDFYVYDKTAKEYIFRGVNVIDDSSLQLLERRRLMLATLEPDLYLGFTWGRIYQYGTYVRTNNVSIHSTPGYKGLYITPLLPVYPNHTYVYPYNVDAKLPKLVLDTDFAESSCAIFTSAATSRTDTSALIGCGGSRTNTHPVRITFKNANSAYAVFASTVPVDDFYVYDETAEEYVFKGKNVSPEYMVNPDAWRFVYDLPEQKSVKLFYSGTPTKVVIDGVLTTVATTYTLDAGRHVIYAWFNPWTQINEYVGMVSNTHTPYLYELRTPTWTDIDVTTNKHYLYWFNNATNLTEIISLCTTPPNFGTGNNASGALRASTLQKIKVPLSAVNAYKTTSPWNNSSIVNKIEGVNFVIN